MRRMVWLGSLVLAGLLVGQGTLEAQECAVQGNCGSVKLVQWGRHGHGRTLGSTLQTNQSMMPGDALQSKGGRYQFQFQSDGNLVVSTRSGRVMWASGTQGSPAARLTMQDDCNLVLYDRFNRPLWSSKTPGNRTRSRLWLEMQDDGNLVVYLRGQALWATGTAVR